MTDDKTKPPAEASSIWGGRFAAGPDKVMEAINASVDFDKRMYAQDITASMAHARMLKTQDIISAVDADTIVSGLETIRGEIESGDFQFSRALEDIHMNVEDRLSSLIGDAAGRLRAPHRAVVRLRVRVRAAGVPLGRVGRRHCGRGRRLHRHA